MPKCVIHLDAKMPRQRCDDMMFTLFFWDLHGSWCFSRFHRWLKPVDPIPFDCSGKRRSLLMARLQRLVSWHLRPLQGGNQWQPMVFVSKKTFKKCANSTRSRHVTYELPADSSAKRNAVLKASHHVGLVNGQNVSKMLCFSMLFHPSIS